VERRRLPAATRAQMHLRRSNIHGLAGAARGAYLETDGRIAGAHRFVGGRAAPKDVRTTNETATIRSAVTCQLATQVLDVE